jgi:hypothetical protein
MKRSSKKNTPFKDEAVEQGFVCLACIDNMIETGEKKGLDPYQKCKECTEYSSALQGIMEKLDINRPDFFKWLVGFIRSNSFREMYFDCADYLDQRLGPTYDWGLWNKKGHNERKALIALILTNYTQEVIGKGTGISRVKVCRINKHHSKLIEEAKIFFNSEDYMEKISSKYSKFLFDIEQNCHPINRGMLIGFFIIKR